MQKITKIAAAILLIFAFTASKAQTTAMDFNTTDCNNNNVHLFSDLDAGKAVILFYYMPGCGTCPPVAQKIQAMANNINAMHANMVKAYAYPFQNSTTCAYSQSWVTDNNLPLYAPMDSGAASVAYYGGFGMPTVVLLGGSDHKVMFSTQSFSTNDTTTMRDMILGMMGGGTTGIENIAANINSLNIYPNPTSNNVTISLDLKEQSDLYIEVLNIIGQQIALISQDKNVTGVVNRSFNTDALANGTYIIRINTDGKTINRRINVLH
jgi:thiol-disulfide isomerase/thioredoxin